MRMRKKAKSGRSVAFLLVALCCSSLVAAKEKKSRANEAPDAVAMVAGTVYRPPGFAISGAEITVDVQPGTPTKFKKLKAVTDSRGEFALRLPPVPATYLVSVQHSGYLPQSKTVAVQGEQRFDLSFLMEAKSQGEGK